MLDATNAWEMIIDDADDLKGLPESAVNAARQDAVRKDPDSKDKERWRFTLQMPSFMPLQSWCLAASSCCKPLARMAVRSILLIQSWSLTASSCCRQSIAFARRPRPNRRAGVIEFRCPAVFL